MSQPFIHPQAICETIRVGDGTRIWAFAHVLAGASIGKDCNICDGVFIENDVVIGDRVTVKGGVQLWDGVALEDDVFIGPNATFTNDPFPRSRERPARFARTTVRSGASIGANATILPGIEIGSRSMIGAGSVVTRSVPSNAIVVGNPARISGYVDASVSRPSLIAPPPLEPGVVGRTDLGVGGAAIYWLRTIRDMRGDLAVAEFTTEFPFAPARFFAIYNVPSREVRGEHAHKQCHQMLCCVRGSCRVMLDDGIKRCDIVLDRGDLGLHLPPMVWGTQYQYSDDALLLVFASRPYEPEDYIRTYGEFVAAIRATK